MAEKFPQRLLVKKEKDNDESYFLAQGDNEQPIAEAGEDVAIYRLVGVKKQVIRHHLSLVSVPNKE